MNCECGHVLDEHYNNDEEMGNGCAVEGCGCWQYEADE